MESALFTKSWSAEYVADDAVHFRLWAPSQQQLTLRLYDANTPMRSAEHGWFELLPTGVAPSSEYNSKYNFVLANGTVVA